MKKYELIKPYADTKNKKRIVNNSKQIGNLTEVRAKELVQKGFIKEIPNKNNKLEEEIK